MCETPSYGNDGDKSHRSLGGNFVAVITPLLVNFQLLHLRQLILFLIRLMVLLKDTSQLSLLVGINHCVIIIFVMHFVCIFQYYTPSYSPYKSLIVHCILIIIYFPKCMVLCRCCYCSLHIWSVLLPQLLIVCIVLLFVQCHCCFSLIMVWRC